MSARVVDITNRVVRLQTGYVYHYAFAMLIGIALITSYLPGSIGRSSGKASDCMTSWPILSPVIFLPLVGALHSSSSIRGEDEAALRNIRWAPLWTTIVTFVVSLLIWLDFDTGQSRHPVRREP